MGNELDARRRRRRWHRPTTISLSSCSFSCSSHPCLSVSERSRLCCCTWLTETLRGIIVIVNQGAIQSATAWKGHEKKDSPHSTKNKTFGSRLDCRVAVIKISAPLLRPSILPDFPCLPPLPPIIALFFFAPRR